MSVELIVVVLSSPVLLAIVNWFLQRGSKLDSIKEIIELKNSFNHYKIEQATMLMKKENSKILGNKEITFQDKEFWLMAHHNLDRMVPEKEWAESLRNECSNAYNKMKDHYNEEIGK